MRQRGISTVPAILLAAAAAMVTSVFMMDWMVIDVQTPEPEDIHITVPFPLLAARVATAFVPDEALAEAEIPPEVKGFKEPVLNALDALLDAPDRILVKVESPDAHVEIAKEGDDLRISVDAEDAVVRCVVPLDGVHEALENWDWQSADPSIIFDILSAAPNGELLRVEADDGTKVTIKMW